MYKKPGRKSHLTDRRSRAANLENLRKDKRGAETFQNRGIDVNEGKRKFFLHISLNVQKATLFLLNSEVLRA